MLISEGIIWFKPGHVSIGIPSGKLKNPILILFDHPKPLPDFETLIPISNSYLTLRLEKNRLLNLDMNLSWFFVESRGFPPLDNLANLFSDFIPFTATIINDLHILKNRYSGAIGSYSEASLVGVDNPDLKFYLSIRY